MKHTLIITGLLIFAGIFTGTGIYGETTDTRTSIAVEQPLVLDTYELPPFQFITADKEQHRAGITVTLAFAGNPELQKELEQKKNIFRDSISRLLGTKKYEDLDSFEDVMNLSEEIKSGINSQLVSGKISEVYFWDFVLE